MSNIDDVYGKFGEDSNHPFFGLPPAGHQWPEGRGFHRCMSNPYAMARLAQVLCGFSAHLVEGGTIRPISEENRENALEAIAGTLGVIIDLYPEILSEEPVDVKKDWDLPPYEADERLAPMIQRALQAGGLIEKEPLPHDI